MRRRDNSVLTSSIVCVVHDPPSSLTSAAPPFSKACGAHKGASNIAYRAIQPCTHRPLREHWLNIQFVTENAGSTPWISQTNVRVTLHSTENAVNIFTSVAISNFMRLQILTAASMTLTAFWDIPPCSLVEIDRRFRGAYCLHHQVNTYL
jgi:hypothetical protein